MAISDLAFSTSTNQYGFGAKEFNPENLNGSALDYYDFHARNYDAQLGRWNSPDILMEMYTSESPYSFTLNNPVNYTDPTGMYVQNDGCRGRLGEWKRGEYVSCGNGGGNGKNTYGGAGYGRNGAGFNGSYYDWYSGEYRTTSGYITSYNEVYKSAIESNLISDKNGEEITVTDLLYTESKTFSKEFFGLIFSDGRYWRVGDVIGGESNFDNWWSNMGTAIELVSQWMFYGKQERVFNNDRVANAFRNSRVVGEARDYWYKKVNLRNSLTVGVTNFRGIKRLGGGNFGLTGLAKAGLDPIEQFVGSTSDFTISSNGTILTYTITNVTSFRSLMYGVTPEWLNFYNTTQTYIFTEPINYNRINKFR